MEYILLIDTSTDKGVVAISGNGKLLAHRVNEETRNHAGTINIMINTVVDDVKISLEELSAIAVCAGPGSYTGLRIGVATAKGMCYALDKPLLLQNRLTLLAYHPYKNGNSSSQYISLLKAREKEYFISIYNRDFVCALPPQHIEEGQLSKIFEKKDNTYMVTDAPEYIVNSMDITNLQIDAEAQINLQSWSFYAFEAYKCNHIVNLSAAEPFYLKQVYTRN